MCKVSVIVPVYNTEKYLRACLESLAAQTLDGIEIIVVNDGSTDGSLAIAEEFAAKYPWFSVYSTENKGVSHARNYGAEKSHGDYLAFVDSDDEVEPDYCKAMYEKAVRDGNDVVVCRYDQIEQKEDGTTFCRPITWKFIDEDNFRLIDHRELLIRLNVEVWNKLFVRELFFQIRFPEGVRFSQDFQCVIEICCLAQNIGTVPEILYHYSRIHGGIVGRICEEKLDIIRSRKQTLEFLQSHHYFPLVKEEYELLCARGIIGMYPRLVKKNDSQWRLRMRIIHETQKFLKESFPNWKENSYIKVLQSRELTVDPLFRSHAVPFYSEMHLLWMVLFSRVLSFKLWNLYYRIDRKCAFLYWDWKRKIRNSNNGNK